MGNAQRKLSNMEENKELKVEFVEYEVSSLEQRDETPELDDASNESEEYDADSESEGDDEDENDIDDEERQLILSDAKMLKQLAVAFLHPEKPVESSPTSTARCYFNRPSAPEQESIEESEYRQMVEADVIALRKAAKDYLHPEVGVRSNSHTAKARCYFDRPSAHQQESVEESEYRQSILADAAILKKYAVDYLHPELGVESSDPVANARCYFDRPSAPTQESAEESEYRQMVLNDAASLKQLAVDYLHPELGVQSSDPVASARCYFDRPSAPTQESTEESEYRQMVLNDAASLKQLAVDYLHPEVGVSNANGIASARCYFDRPSAPTQESAEESEYRQMVLNDAASLKQLAVDYLHPEVGVTNTHVNPTASARCYFDRPSAPTQESAEESEYRQMVLNDAASLKQLAVDYLHPELGVTNVNPTASARCYFDRPSALLENTTAFNPPVHKSSKAVVPTSRKSVKTIEPAMESPIAISLSSVQLYGLDNDNADPAF